MEMDGQEEGFKKTHSKKGLVERERTQSGAGKGMKCPFQVRVEASLE